MGRHNGPLMRPVMSRPMIGHEGLVEQLSRLDELTLYNVKRLCDAYPQPIQACRLVICLDGTYATSATGATMVSELRALMGSKVIQTLGARKGGYLASPELCRALEEYELRMEDCHLVEAGNVLSTYPTDEVIAMCDNLHIHPRVRVLIDRGLRDPELSRALILASRAGLPQAWAPVGQSKSITRPSNGAGGASLK